MPGKAQHPFEQFLDTFIPKVAAKARQLNKAVWILETTGTPDAADLKAELDIELKVLMSGRDTYEKLLKWDKDPTLKDPLLKRQLSILIRSFKPNLIPTPLLEEISERESALSQSYANFRASVDGKPLSENGVREILKNENDPGLRKKTWEASKEVGDILAPQILKLVALRNEAAKSLGYPDYFQMQLELQEVDGKWLDKTLKDLAERSDAAYTKMLSEIEDKLSQRFHVQKSELGPWAWSDPFCQEDPLDVRELDSLVTELDIAGSSAGFYKKMGIDVQPILQKSDMYEREGKSQHAFCINIDRSSDVRTLNNVQPSIKWLETVLHELGHAIYEMFYEENLPWLLREPPHMITTEAMALIAGRQAYQYHSLTELLKKSHTLEPIMQRADSSLKRRQLIFSRWVLVMTFFEKELYRDPSQNLSKLWWEAVEKFQKIKAPTGREKKNDWAAKYHIGLAPVYYFSYLLGEMFASEITEALHKQQGSNALSTEEAGTFLKSKLFAPGNKMSWYELTQHVTGRPLTADAWLAEFAGSFVKSLS